MARPDLDVVRQLLEALQRREERPRPAFEVAPAIDRDSDLRPVEVVPGAQRRLLADEGYGARPRQWEAESPRKRAVGADRDTRQGEVETLGLGVPLQLGPAEPDPRDPLSTIPGERACDVRGEALRLGLALGPHAERGVVATRRHPQRRGVARTDRPGPVRRRGRAPDRQHERKRERKSQRESRCQGHPRRDPPAKPRLRPSG